MQEEAPDQGFARPAPFHPPYRAPGALFDALDINQDGSLGPDEIGAEMAGQQFSDIDSDQSETVTRQEWESVFLGTWDRAPMHTELLAEYFIWLMSEAVKIPNVGEALRIGREGMVAFPKSFRLSLNVGWLAHTAGDIDLAEQCAILGRELRPDRSDPLCLAAAVERSRGNFDEEETLLLKAAQLPGHNPCGELTLARRYMSHSDPQAAYAILQGALERNGWAPGVDKELRLPLGQAAYDLGRTEEAGYHAIRAVSLDTQSRRAWQLVADYLRRTGEFDLSREILDGIAASRGLPAYTTKRRGALPDGGRP